MRYMTPAQESVYRVIVERHEGGDPAPTLKEIAEEAKMALAMVHRRVVALEKKGYIERNGYKSWRNIRLRIIV